MKYRVAPNTLFRARSVHPHFAEVNPLRDPRVSDAEKKRERERMDVAMAITNARLGKIRVCFPAHA